MDDVLVSVLIPNYNYGHYLRDCFDSILAQTYKNIEVIFRDNNSTDNSFEIAMEYYHKFKEKGIYFSIHQNKHNYGSDTNSKLCVQDCHGDIIYTIASDDTIEPTFIEKCVSVLSKNPNVSMVMTHRNEIDETGVISREEPFYNKSCIIEGEKQAAVYMMSGIAIPGQRIGRRNVLDKLAKFNRKWNVCGDWFMNFLYSCVGDIAYIKEPLCNYRVHSGNETNISENNLVGSFEHYLLINTFADISKTLDMKLPLLRYQEAILKLGSMCLRYAVKMLLVDNIDVAKRYLQLALVYDPEINKTYEYKKIYDFTTGSYINKEKIMKEFDILKRTRSYNPPEGFIEIDSYGNKIK